MDFTVWRSTILFFLSAANVNKFFENARVSDKSYLMWTLQAVDIAAVSNCMYFNKIRCWRALLTFLLDNNIVI
jgi:hypothetical protein